MSTEQDQARLLAERIARRVSEGKTEARAPRVESRTDVGRELSVMRASLEELQLRLARIESHVTRNGDETFQAEREAESSEQGSAQRETRQSVTTSSASRSPWLSGMYVPAAAHPSEERFGVEEAAVSELVDFFEGEKKCELEPGGKPCDHCAMCSTRGF
ncbi:MAG: hypothetical protein QOH25_3234 [Acidobacteriota bacterium]|jgi:hypothetical protein|nr:hypothetical protein [Acidobacteriota bacterium]